MKTIAFKKAKNSPAVKSSLHPEFICEFADISLFPEGFHKPEEGWEFLPEDEFNNELLLNDLKHKQNLEERRKKELEQQASQSYIDEIKAKEEEKARREYEEFLVWKKLNKK